jgi:hypothetical protein
MPGYRGELGPAEAQLMTGGTWYFDRAATQLVYVVSNGRYFNPGRTGSKCIRLHVKSVRAQPSGARDDGAVLGLQVTPVEPYRWM